MCNLIIENMTIKEKMELGVQKINSGDLSGGMRLVNEAISLNPNDPEWLHFRGQVYAAQKKAVEAITDYKKAIALDRNVYQYHYNLGNIYMDFRQFQDAVDSFTEAANVNPNDVDIYANRGMCLIQLSKRKEAYNDFTRTLKVDPTNHVAKVGLDILLSVDPSLTY